MESSRTRGWGGLARAAALAETRCLDVRTLRPADVVTAAVRAIHEDHAGTKYRPCVVLSLREDDDQLTVILIGLTSKRCYADGKPRQSLVDWDAVPLKAPAWVFSSRPAFVPAHDVHKVLGRITARDAALLLENITGESVVDRDAFLWNAA